MPRKNRNAQPKQKEPAKQPSVKNLESLLPRVKPKKRGA